MARAIRWQGSFMSRDGKQCTVNIYDEGWSGDVTTLAMAADPFTYEEDDSDNLLDVIRTKTGYLRVVEETRGELSDMYPETNVEHYVTVTYGGSTVFVGYIQAQSFDQDYLPAPRVLSFPVVSPLGVAGGLRLSIPSSPSYVTLASVLKECIDILNAGITTLIFPDYMVSTTERVLAMKVNTLSYCPFNDDYNIYVGSTQPLYKAQSVAEFIEALCNCFGLMVHDNGTSLIFTRFDYEGNYNQYSVETLGNTTPTFQAITSGGTVLNVTSSPRSADSKEAAILPVNNVEINYEDETDPTYECPIYRSKAHTYGDNYVLLTPSTDEISSNYLSTSSMPAATSNSVAVCATNGSDIENSGYKEQIMFSRVTGASNIFTWKLYNIPKYSANGCRLSFKLKAVTWHQVDGRNYYDTADAKAKSVGVRIKNGTLYLQSNGTWAAVGDSFYRNTGGTEGDSSTWELTFSHAMNDYTKPLEITFFYGYNNEDTGLYAIEDLKIEPIMKGITAYLNNDNSNQVTIHSSNGSPEDAHVSQTMNIKRKSEDALVNTSGKFYETVACRYTYLFVTQRRLLYDTFLLPSAVYYLNKVQIHSSTIRYRVIGFNFDLWNDAVTIIAQGSSTL